ncbi:MAG: pyrophosphate--fructose-6-phosphate 1-phosphotransferase [Bifidobacteriaceae bacterium]|jgi:pyrophosphate--fructose-6-phosphate 1-phosphotransferase|nr:pyrophosphate--fructose-6-phosphate 1-phosphotransferase [Bifidobacteriaceae bacterium]
MRVAFLTAGGLAPCLSTSIAYLIEIYQKMAPSVELLGYRYGYTGLLRGDLQKFSPAAIRDAELLVNFGGSPLGNSRVKLTNDDDLLRKGLITAGQSGLARAAERLKIDKINVLHTIGGDDTNTTAADLAAYLAEQGYNLQVVGLPKTIDNDIIPVRQSLGADTAADVAVLYAKNFLAEHTATERVLLVHEVMGRHCGFLTAQAAAKYHAEVQATKFFGHGFDDREQWDVHGVYIPELSLDLETEGKRLKKVLNDVGNVNIFVSEGSVPEELFHQIDAPLDAFGHVSMEYVNAGKWLGDQLQTRIGAEKVLVQKSGYYSRSAASNKFDRKLIYKACQKAVEAALNGDSGLIGQDDNTDNFHDTFHPHDDMQIIDFRRVAGSKAFDINSPWFVDFLKDIGQSSV